MKTKRKLISYFCILALVLTMMPTVAFGGQISDISDHWAKDQITSLMDKSFITGYEDGTFKPDNNITRAEFMAIINRAFNYTEKAEGSYIDVPDSAWYTDVIKQAKAAGYISGYADGTIKPNNYISRQEAAVIIAKIKNYRKCCCSFRF